MNSISIFSSFNEFKGDFRFDGFSFNRDLTDRKTSSVYIWNLKHIKLEPYDIFKIYNFLSTGVDILGLVIEINEDTKSNRTELVLVYGADTFLNTIYIEGNTQQPNNITETNGTDLTLNIVSDSVVTATDQLLRLDTVCRQLMRRAPMFENYDLLNNIISIVDSEEPVYKFIEREPTISNIKKEIATDTFDKFILFLDTDKSQSLTGYLTNGVFSQTPDLTHIYTERTETVMVDNFNYDYLESKLKSQSYNNKFEFETLLHNSIKPLVFSNDILGRKVELYLDGGEIIETIISAYEIKNDFTIKYKLGLSRSRLSDIINKKED